MKKLLFFLLLLCFSLFFTACSEAEIQPPASDASIESTMPTSALTIMTEPPVAPVVEPKEYRVSFIAAGDNIVYYGNVRDAQKNAEGTEQRYDFRPSYTDIKEIVEEHDLAFINQETLMCGDGYDLSYYPRFNSPTELGNAVVDTGFDIIGMANNHMLDKGESGLLATLDYWENQPVTRIGAYRSRADFDAITVIEKNGIKIALLAFTYGTNGLSLPASSEVYIPYIDEALIREKVTEAETLADVTIVSIHWGYENTFRTNDQQREIAKLISECGGDVILGHHPHVIQPIEWIESGDNRTLCIYSLGNFMAEMAADYNMLGGMLSFELVKRGDEAVIVENAVFIPTVFDFNKSFYNNHIYLLEAYTEEQAKNHGISYYGNHTTLAKLRGYVTDTIPAEFLPAFLKEKPQSP